MTSRSGSAAIDGEKAFFFSRFSVDAAAHGRLVLCLENGTRCGNTKQEQRQTRGDAEGVICSSVDGADGHGVRWVELMGARRLPIGSVFFAVGGSRQAGSVSRQPGSKLADVEVVISGSFLTASRTGN